MTVPKYLTTITTFSKLMALFLFILFPIAGFCVGMQYQQSITPINQPELLVRPTRKPSESDGKPTPIDEITDWNRYTHQYFSFKYPPTWHAYENPDYPDGNTIIFSELGTQYQQYEADKSKILFTFTISDEPKTIEQLKNDYNTLTTIGERKALKTPSQEYTVKINDKQKIYIFIDYVAPDLIEKILSTFHFFSDIPKEPASLSNKYWFVSENNAEPRLILMTLDKGNSSIDQVEYIGNPRKYNTPFRVTTNTPNCTLSTEGGLGSGGPISKKIFEQKIGNFSYRMNAWKSDSTIDAHSDDMSIQFGLRSIGSNDVNFAECVEDIKGILVDLDARVISQEEKDQLSRTNFK